MRKPLIVTIIVGIVFLVIGYLLGNFLPFRNTSGTPATTNTNQPNNLNTANDTVPSGKGLLKVTVVDSTNKPMVGIEVDVNYTPGPPPSWGVVEADTNGVARFTLDPGSYSIYFNSNRFPSEYAEPVGHAVTITSGEIKEVTITLQKI